MVYTWNLNPIALSLFGLDIRWYGLAYLAGVLVALTFGWKCWQQAKIESQKSQFENFVFSTFLAGIIGGRLGLFLFYAPETFWENPLEILKIWNGGMSIHGGVLGAVIWGLFQCHKNKWPIFKVADVFMIPLAVSLVLGRIANFVNGELHGRLTDQTWGVIFPHVDKFLRHPSQLYEASANFLMLITLILIWKKFGFQKPGLITAITLLMYGTLRIIVEFFREPEIVYFGITMGQWLSTGLAVLALLIAHKRRYWIHKK